VYICKCGPGSSVGIATDYRLDGPGIKSRWGRDFLLVQTSPGAHPASCKLGIRSFPGVKYGWGVLLTTHPLLEPRSWKSRAIPLPPLGHNRACNRVTLLLLLNTPVADFFSLIHIRLLQFSNMEIIMLSVLGCVY
jgi:hypothetical protein